MLEFRVLGPIEVVSDGKRVALGKGTERALLGALVLAAGKPVSAGELIDALWGERPPATAPEMIRNYVARLRGRLGPELVETTPAGYRLVVTDEAIDLKRFEQLAAEGAQALEGGDPARASNELRQALALWRGRPAPELEDAQEYAPLLGALEELRLRVQEDWIEAELALGHAAQLVHELEVLHDRHPYRERLLRQLMLALYRSGRQKEALDRYASGRRRLRDDVGLEPSAELQELQHAILRQDPSLTPRRPTPPQAHPDGAGETRPVPTRRRRLAVVALVAVVAAAVATGFAEWPRAAAVALPSRGVVALDARSGRAVAAAPIRVRPGTLAVDGRHVWVSATNSAAVFRFSSQRPAEPRVVRIPQPAFSLAALDGSLWVANGFAGTMSRIAPSGRVSAAFRPEPRARGRLPLAAGSGQLWAASQDGTLTRFDPAGHRLRTYSRIGEAEAIAIDGGRIWLALATSDAVERFDVHAGRAAGSTPVGGRPSDLVVGDGAVWALTPLENTLWRIDPKRNAVVQSFSVPSSSSVLAWTPGRIWVGSTDGVLLTIDTSSNKIVRTQSLARPIDGLAGDGRILWVSVG